MADHEDDPGHRQPGTERRENDARRIGIAVSGGGHRATLWAVGVLMYLADAGVNRHVVAISSVSGGSIANGVVGHELDYELVDGERFEAAIGPLVDHVANEGLFFWGRSTNRYVISLFASAALAALLTFGSLVLLVVDGFAGEYAGSLASGIGLSLFCVWYFRRRSLVLDRALSRTHFSRDRTPTRLDALERAIDHVFCATELQAGGHLYLSPRFAYAYRFGAGRPGPLALSTAVQASACFPGAFAARRLPTAEHGFQGGMLAHPPSEMVLVDGGVYDNMADQWLTGLADRLARDTEIDVRGRELDDVIVVNASARKTWRPVTWSRLPFVAELAEFKRVNDVMYDVTTSRRRKALVDDWERSQVTGEGAHGALVQIAQSPFNVALAYRDDPERGARSRAVLQRLGDAQEQRDLWAERADTNTQVKTVLRKLGVATSAGLLEHAYVLSMCNLHVLLGYPLLDLPGRDRFTRIAEGR